MSDLQLEQMTEADLVSIVPMELQSHQHPWTRRHFIDSLKAGHWAYCVRQVDAAHSALAEIHAYCILLPGVDELHLLNITVAPHLRKKGIARRMMQAIENLALQYRLPRILLEVRPSNTAAFALYQSLNFKEIARRKNYYPLRENPNQREDACVMEKVLQ